jgi:hypothetical protein
MRSHVHVLGVSILPLFYVYSVGFVNRSDSKVLWISIIQPYSQNITGNLVYKKLLFLHNFNQINSVLYIYSSVTSWFLILLYPTLVLFESSNCIDWIFLFCMYCHWPKNSFSDTPVTCYLLRFVKLVKDPVHIYQSRFSRDNYIILLFNSKYERRWIDVIFLQDKHNINAVS